jgi:hypothetical protein
MSVAEKNTERALDEKDSPARPASRLLLLLLLCQEIDRVIV